MDMISFLCALTIPAFDSITNVIRCHIGVHCTGGHMDVDRRGIVMATGSVTKSTYSSGEIR